MLDKKISSLIKILGKNLSFIAFSSFFFLIHDSAFGHSGGLNSSGCHGGSKPYHCHRAPSEMVGNRLRCDLGSRSEDCQKSPPIVPKTNPQSETVIKRINPLQVDQEKLEISQYKMSSAAKQAKLPIEIIRNIQLRLKFMGLYGGLIDGVLGPETALAIETFLIINSLPTNDYSSTKFLTAIGVIE